MSSKAFIYKVKVNICMFITPSMFLIIPRYWNSCTLSQSHLPGKNTAQFSAAVVAIHTAQNFVPPGTHYSWVDRGGVDSNPAQGFHA